MHVLTGLIGAFIITLAVAGYSLVATHQPQPPITLHDEPTVGATYIRSLQLAADPTTGECLTTNGTDNAWSTSCGSGGGSGGGTWSTTTTAVAGVLFNYPNNDDDVVLVGSNSSTTAEFFFDPNTTLFSHTGWPISTSTAMVCKSSFLCKYTTITSALAAGWRPVEFKADTYSEQITIQNTKTNLFGESLLSIIQFNGSSQSPGISTNSKDETTLSRFTLNETNAAEAGIGIDMGDSSLNRILFARLNDTATTTRIRDTANNSFYNLIMGNTYFNCGATCLELSGSQANANISAFNRYRPAQKTPGGFGHYIQDARGFASFGDDIEGTSTTNGITGVYIATTSRDISYFSPWIEGNQVNLNIDSGASAVNFFGGTITSGGTDIINNGSNVCFWNVNVTGRKLNECNGDFSILSPGIFFASSTLFSSATTSNLTITTGASTTRLSVFQEAKFGGTATSSFNSAGVLTLASALGVASGGTGLTNFGGTDTVLFTSSAGNLLSDGDFTFNTSSNTLTLPSAGEIMPFAHGDGDLGTSIRSWNQLYVLNASTSAISSFCHILCAFGGTATSTFSSAGVLTAVGGTYTGIHTFTSATQLVIPGSSNPTIDAIGEIGFDTTASEMLVGTSTASGAPAVFKPYITISFSYASTTQGAATTTRSLAPADDAGYISQISCDFNNFMDVSIYDGSNRLNLVKASSTNGVFKYTTNNTFTAQEDILVDIGTTTNIASEVRGGCRARYFYTRN